MDLSMDLFSFSKRPRITLALFLLLCVLCPQAHAQSGVVIDISNPERSLYPIAIPTAANGSSMANQVASIARFNLSIAGWFRVLDPASFLANLKGEGLGIEPGAWTNVGAFGVMKYRVVIQGNQVVLTTRLYEVEKGAQPVLGRQYTGPSAKLRQLVHQWCNDVVTYYTGEAGFFGSKLAFVARARPSGKQIMVVDFDGHRPYSLIRNRSINILPAWSPSSNQIAFTSYARGNPDLYVLGRGGGRSKRISRVEGMNIGASWSPDGSKIALTLSRDGNPEIYIIRASDGAMLRRLTNNRAIDTSPAWSPNGKEIAFVSDRQGGPQIFVMNANGGNQRRVSFNGNYNTTPDWSPQKGARILAYTTRVKGAFDIVTLDLNSGTMTRITQNQGTNEEPSFSPNGRAIAFASRRKQGAGIYIANADGSGIQHRIYSGYATSIDWGSAP